MKKITLLAALLIGGIVTANAQKIETPKLAEKVGTTPIKKGNWIVGGALGSTGYSFEDKSFNINLSPRAGYFISDGIAVGLEVGAGLQTVKDASDIWSYKVMPFARYYFPEGASETGRFFGQGAVGISGAETSNSSDTSFAFALNAGYSHFVTRNVALEAIVGYNYSKSNQASASAHNGLGLSVGFQIFLGK
ncbi:outer membrane beta-barrel protein [Myroides pelagicus]|uniref:Outer membrane beta-barrel protein n=1 Tax=Myroides pelagicus TaxID=270914 RepID=A0A7K1GT41_9FLAO|nr:outer membrane beta-barrel protein [Myroides pelagicus]MTH31083.1 outer membrane beta-barrel protein [Myroides pelagicus]